ncbi:N-acetylmuramoyl-L-alanine amidase [Roseovarius faecimaris]|uniref:N-acetylmuramoyl-L-alanine amidase n=2 Tax=Roseovarius faecimaris TaxID=2494550 RepID=A0A6I6IT01_9RHOB|nr:N-acetylmuramoyl-L-alanine amidase [Roseovarius faecimaris]
MVAAALLGLWAAAAGAQEFSGLARVLPEGSGLQDAGEGIELRLRLSQGVPYRVFTLEDPERLVLDFREVDWSGADAAALDRAERVSGVRMGGFRPGWSRMVVDLAGPYLVRTADLSLEAETGQAELIVRLEPGSAEAFADAAGAPSLPGWDVPTGGEPVEKPLDNKRLKVMLDPGHGGIDPGADQGGVLEKDLMLLFAIELRELLLRSGEIEVAMTRHDDSFVSLERRVALAHQAGADLFLSLHADALSEGRAHGATVYTLSEEASDAASAALAERHDRADILAGIDLQGQDDVVADILIDLARLETQPRAERFAEALRLGIKQRGLKLAGRPMRSAGFSVLKSADIPSVLLELGFLSSAKDRANLKNPEWRAVMAASIRDAIIAWQRADAATRDLVRQ